MLVLYKKPVKVTGMHLDVPPAFALKWPGGIMWVYLRSHYIRAVPPAITSRMPDLVAVKCTNQTPKGVSDLYYLGVGDTLYLTFVRFTDIVNFIKSKSHVRFIRRDIL